MQTALKYHVGKGYPRAKAVQETNKLELAIKVVFTRLTNMSAENVIVVARCRPFNEKEMNAGHTNVSKIDTKTGSIALHNPKTPSDVKTFTFDAVFDETCTQV